MFPLTHLKHVQWSGCCISHPAAGLKLIALSRRKWLLSTVNVQPVRLHIQTVSLVMHTEVLRLVQLNHTHAARAGRTVFSQFSAAVVRHKANNGLVYAIRAWFKYDTALSAVV